MPPIIFALSEVRCVRGAALGVGPSFMGGIPQPPTRYLINGITRDSSGSPLANCTVYLFNMVTGLPVLYDWQISDGAGNYAFSVSGDPNFWAVDYKAGLPDVAGASVNTLQGTVLGSIAPGIKIIAHVVVGSSSGGTFDTSLFPIDTTGANFLLFLLSSASAVPTVTDNYANTWNARTRYVNADNGVRFSYAYNTTLVGPGHYWTVTGGSSFGSIAVVALQLVKATANPYDQENGNSGAGVTTLSPGSITPTLMRSIVFFGASWNTTGGIASVPSDYSMIDTLDFLSLKHYGIGLAYQIQNAPLATNPTWNFGISVSNPAVNIASFLPIPTT